MPKHKIFIIEDEHILLFGLKAKFSNEGYEVKTHDGTGELESLIHNLIDYMPDYIVLDLVLPGFEGFEALGRIKADDNLNAIPVFIFTNYSGQDIKQRCRDIGADYILLKTEFNIDEFVEKFKNIIKNMRVRC